MSKNLLWHLTFIRVDYLTLPFHEDDQLINKLNKCHQDSLSPHLFVSVGKNWYNFTVKPHAEQRKQLMLLS